MKHRYKIGQQVLLLGAKVITGTYLGFSKTNSFGEHRIKYVRPDKPNKYLM